MEILQKFDVVDDKIFDLACKLAKINDTILPPLASFPNRTIKLNQGTGILLSNTLAQDLSQNREWTISVDTTNLLNFSFNNSYFDNSQSGSFTGIARRISNTLYGLIDNYTGENVTFSKVVTKPDTTSYTDADIDGVIITKKGNEFFKRNYTGLIDIKWFGAKGDGINNDAPAIQAAIDIGSIYIGEGTYILNTKINIPSNRSINGEGKKTILKVNDDFDSTKFRVLSNSDIVNGNNNITIDNVSIDLQNIVIASEGEAEGRGFISMEGVTNLTLNRIYTASNYNGQIPIWLWDAKKLKITNCDLFNNVVTGEGGCIWIMAGRTSSDSAKESYDITITNNTLKSNVDEAISLLPVYGKVYNGKVYGNTLTAIGTYPSFSCVGNRITGSTYAEVYDIDVYGNTINQGWVNIGSGARDIDFHDNTLNGTTSQTGIFAFFSDVSHLLQPNRIKVRSNNINGYQIGIGLNTINSEFTDNKIKNSSGFAIDASGYEAGNIIDGNIINVAPIGIRVGQRGWKLRNNIIYSVTDGIILASDFSNSKVQNNIIKGNTGVGIKIIGDVGTTYNNLIVEDNQVEGVGTGIGLKVINGAYGSDNKLHNNKSINNGVEMANFTGWHTTKNEVTTYLDPYIVSPEIVKKGTNLYQTSGNLGINIDTPTKELHIKHGDAGGVLIQYTGGNKVLIDSSSIQAFNADGTVATFKINESGGLTKIGSSSLSSSVQQFGNYELNHLDAGGLKVKYPNGDYLLIDASTITPHKGDSSEPILNVTGKVAGVDGTASNHFVTKQQLSASTSSTFSDTGFTI